MYGSYCSESGKLCIFIVHKHGGVFEQCIICPMEERSLFAYLKV